VIDGKSNGEPKVLWFVDSTKKIDTVLNRIRFDSRRSRPEILGPPKAEQKQSMRIELELTRFSGHLK